MRYLQSNRQLSTENSLFFLLKPSERLLAKRLAMAKLASPLHFLSSAIATSLGKPIFTKLATSDSFNGSPEAACGWAGVGAEELEEPAFGSEVSMLCSAADLARASASCLSSRLLASLAEAFKAAASPSSPDPAPDSLAHGGSSFSERNLVSVPVVPIIRQFFRRSLVH